MLISLTINNHDAYNIFYCGVSLVLSLVGRMQVCNAYIHRNQVIPSGVIVRCDDFFYSWNRILFLVCHVCLLNIISFYIPYVFFFQRRRMSFRRKTIIEKEEEMRERKRRSSNDWTIPSKYKVYNQYIKFDDSSSPSYMWKNISLLSNLFIYKSMCNRVLLKENFAMWYKIKFLNNFMSR